MRYPKLIKTTIVLLIIVLVVVILVYGKPFMVPLTFAALLAMLLLPVTKWLQKKGVNKTLAIVLSILVLVGFFALLVGFVSWQVSDLASDAAKIEQQISAAFQQFRNMITQQIGLPPEKQQQIIKQQQSSSTSNFSSFISGAFSGLGNFLMNTVLVLVYIFLFIYFRGRLKRFVMILVPAKEKPNALDAISRAQQVAQKYLTGLSLMIMCLWVMYSIGFSVAGVKNAIFFAVLCGLLEIVPFIGNLVGTTLTLGMTLVQGGGMNVVIGILLTYGLVQFIQTYILEPLVVGAEVSINPLFTIVGLVAGEMLWGIPGMILAIPLMGIAKIVFDHVEALKPYAYLIGEERKEDSGFKKKIKNLGTTIKGWLR